MRTEAVDPRFVEIDAWPTETAIEAMLEGQLAAIAAVQPAPMVSLSTISLRGCSRASKLKTPMSQPK